MRRRKIAKYAGLTIGCTAVCVAVIFALQTGHVFGKYTPPETYIKGEPMMVNTVVTSEGGNQKGTLGSGAKPCSSEVPTAEGLKGSETNPFVLLEVVPDKAMQQWTYLSGNTEYGMPESLDALKLGIEISKESGKSEHRRSFVRWRAGDDFGRNRIGTWFSSDQYSVYKIGSNREKENKLFAEITKLYEVNISSSDLEDPEQFKKDFDDNKYNVSFDNDNHLTVKKEFFDKYANLFNKDDHGEKIRDIAKEDVGDWEVKSEKRVIEEAKGETYKSGYLVAVEPGKGDLGYASEEDFDLKQIHDLTDDWDFYGMLTKTGTDKDRWVYVETKEELEERFPDYTAINWYWGDITGSNLKEYLYKPELTGRYFDVSNAHQYFCESPEVSEQVYTFEYYGFKTNEIVKRALFSFRDQEEYDNFHMKVICMTPAEINEISKKDTDETLDMIERADMFSFQTIITHTDGIAGGTDNAPFFSELYHKVILGEEDYEYKRENLTLFNENDLEWDLCSKVIRRVSENKNLPLAFNQLIGTMAKEGVDLDASKPDTHMYFKHNGEMICEKQNGSLNNIVKMYLVSVQFDLLARKEQTGVKRTFMEDIFPYIKEVEIEKGEGTIEGSASKTAFYDQRLLCNCDGVTQEEKEKSYYLWNAFTFIPMDLDTQNIDKNKYLEQGFLDSFFAVNSGNPFKDDNLLSQQKGSDGSDDKNVMIPHNGDDTNQSWMLGGGSNAEAAGVASNAFETAYQIMNGQSENVETLTVNVLKQKKRYVKISDNAILIDYNSLAKYKEDKTLYVKVSVTNTNNEAGILKKVRLVSDSGEPIDVPIQETTDPSTVMKKEDVTNSEGNDPIHGYRVDGTITFYIPYSLYKWQSGYMSVELTTQGRIYNAKKEKFVKGKENVHEISIGERNLFNLE